MKSISAGGRADDDRRILLSGEARLSTPAADVVVGWFDSVKQVLQPVVSPVVGWRFSGAGDAGVEWRRPASVVGDGREIICSPGDGVGALTGLD